MAEFIIGWSLFGIGLCVLFYVIKVLKNRYDERRRTWNSQKAAEERRVKQARDREFRELVKNNLARLPNSELPPLDIDWTAVNRFITITRFEFSDKGDKFRYGGGVNYWDEHYILKSDYSSDTLRLIEMLRKDINWFSANPTGMTLSEQDDALTVFLRKNIRGFPKRVLHG